MREWILLVSLSAFVATTGCITNHACMSSTAKNRFIQKAAIDWLRRNALTKEMSVHEKADVVALGLGRYVAYPPLERDYVTDAVNSITNHILRLDGPDRLYDQRDILLVYSLARIKFYHGRRLATTGAFENVVRFVQGYNWADDPTAGMGPRQTPAGLLLASLYLATKSQGGCEVAETEFSRIVKQLRENYKFDLSTPEDLVLDTWIRVFAEEGRPGNAYTNWLNELSFNDDILESSCPWTMMLLNAQIVQQSMPLKLLWWKRVLDSDGFNVQAHDGSCLYFSICLGAYSDVDILIECTAFASACWEHTVGSDEAFRSVRSPNIVGGVGSASNGE